MQQATYVQPILDALWGYLIWLFPVLIALIALTALKALTPRLRGWWGERRVGAVLERFAEEVQHDLILPDGRGGLTQIDHLALIPAGLLVVETKNYSGIVPVPCSTLFCVVSEARSGQVQGT